jgi:hypothetical protein
MEVVHKLFISSLTWRPADAIVARPDRSTSGFKTESANEAVFTTLVRNIIGCFKGWMVVWHLVAILSTVLLVKSGFDWWYYEATYHPELRFWMFWAARIGFLVPILLPLYIGVGVSMTIHWFSDFVAGAMMGTVIGRVVGRSYGTCQGGSSSASP